MTKRTAVTAGLALTAPLAFLGLVLLPVGIVVQIGTQSALRVENRTDRRLWVTPIGTRCADGGRAIVRQAFTGLLPLPAFQGADLPIDPGQVRTIVYKAGPYRSTELLVRDVSRDFRLHRPPQVPIEGFTGLPAADPKDVGFASSFPQILPWTMIAAGLLGLAAFLQFLRLRRRLEKQGL